MTEFLFLSTEARSSENLFLPRLNDDELRVYGTSLEEEVCTPGRIVGELPTELFPVG